MSDTRVRFIEHNGKQILLLDYSNIRFESEFISHITTVRDFVLNLKRKDLLVLIDLSGSFLFGNTTDELKKVGLEFKPYVKKDAVVGIVGAKATLLNLINKVTGLGTPAFSSHKEACDFLTENDS